MNTSRKYPSPVDYVSHNRAVLRPGAYMILPPENRCPSHHPNLLETVEQVFVTQKPGAGYVMSELTIHPGGGTKESIESEWEHFLFVLEGWLNVKTRSTQEELEPGSYAWLPPDHPIEFKAPGSESCRALWFRRIYQPLEKVNVPEPVFGNERDVPAIPDVDLNPEKQLIPYIDPGIDMAFNLIVVLPGAYYGLVETHAWEHAMYMLEGEGILALNGEYNHVRQGDFIHIAPYCPEWFGALGMEPKPVRFLLHWDCNRDYGKPNPWSLNDSRTIFTGTY